MKKNCKPGNFGLRMAMGGGMAPPRQDRTYDTNDPVQTAYNNHAAAMARVPTTPWMSTTGPSNMGGLSRPAVEPSQNTYSTHVNRPAAGGFSRPAVEPGGYTNPDLRGDTRPPSERGPMQPAPSGGDFRPGENPRSPGVAPPNLNAPTPAPQQVSNAVERQAGEGQSALEQRLNSRMAAGTLTVRGADMLKGMEEARRNDLTNRYGFDTQSATARMNDATNRYNIDSRANESYNNNLTQRYGYDIGSADNRYNTDAQIQNNIRDNDTRLTGFYIQSGDNRYNTDAQTLSNIRNNQTQLQGYQTQADSNRYNTDAHTNIAMMNDMTQRYGMDNQVNMNADNNWTSRYNSDVNAMSRGGFGLRLRDGGQIHAVNGFQHGGFAERSADIPWLSPVTRMSYQAQMANADADLALKNEQLRQAQSNYMSPEMRQAHADAAERIRQGVQQHQDAQTYRQQQIEDENRRIASEDRATRQGRERAAYNQSIGGFGSRSVAGPIQTSIPTGGGADSAGLRGGYARAADYGVAPGYSQADVRAQQLQDYNMQMGRDEFGLKSQNLQNQYELAKASDARAQQLQDYNMQMGRDDRSAAAAQLSRNNTLQDADRQIAAQQLVRNNGIQDTQLTNANADRLRAHGIEDAAIARGNRLQDEDRAHANADRAMRNQNLVEDRARNQRFQDEDRSYAQTDRFRQQQLQDQAIARNNHMQDQLAGNVADDRSRFYARQGARDQASAQNQAVYQDLLKRMAPNQQPGGLPAFQMRNGGEIHAAKGGLWGAIKGAVGMGESDDDFARRKAAERAEAEARQQQQNNMPDVRRGLDGQGGNSVDNRMRAAGAKNGGTLQTGHGGVVPGTGKGDKIPAEYEPGEFVVSNDMLAADPSLLPRLRELRQSVLAKKGMTPEQADAQAIHMDSEGPGDERGAKDERESKAVKRGFGLRAQSGGDLFGPDFFGTDEENARLIAAAKAEKAAKDAESNQVRVDEYGNPVVGLEKWLGRTSGTRVVAPASDSAPPDAQDLGARDRQRIAQHKAASQSPSNAATQEEMRTAFDSRETPTKPASKDAPAVLQGATGKDVGFGITRFNVPGQSPLFTNMTDEAGMRSNEALISRKPQSDTDRIAGDNLANRFAQRQGAEDRMAQRQAELQAEYQQGQVDNRAIASSERQREFLNEQRNLERNIPNKEEAPGVNARIAALKAARLGEGANFGARENALALDQARSAATIGVHAGDNASRERIADKELAAKAPGYALDRELTQEKISHERELNAAQKGYAGAIAAGNKNAADMYREQIVALSNKLSDSKFSAIPGRVVPDPMGGEPHVIPPTIWDSHSGQIVQQKGGANQVARSISPGEVVNGFRFKGGNTKDRNNWEKV